MIDVGPGYYLVFNLQYPAWMALWHVAKKRSNEIYMVWVSNCRSDEGVDWHEYHWTDSNLSPTTNVVIPSTASKYKFLRNLWTS